MNEKKDLILKASLEVFSEKGYQSATTLEISRKAGVSEMTLFRHFQTKNNLFIDTIKEAIGSSIIDDQTMNLDEDLRIFIQRLLHEKMLMISNHSKLIRMLIRESLAHTLPDEFAFTKMVYQQVIHKISNYVSHHQIDVDSISFAEIIVGLLLRYAIKEDQPTYHLLDQDEQNKYLSSYLNILNI